MNEGIRPLILLVMIAIASLAAWNGSLLVRDNPRDGWVVHAASAPRAGRSDPTLPQKQEILALLKKANSWQLAHPIMKPDDRNWERATWFTGVMAAWKATQERPFLDQALAWGRQHQWQVGTESVGANRLFCVETWAELYFVQKDPAMIAPAIKWLATPDPISPAREVVVRRPLCYQVRLCGLPLWRLRARHAGQSHRRREVYRHHECLLR